MRHVIARVGLLCAVLTAFALLTAGVATAQAEGGPQSAIAATAVIGPSHSVPDSTMASPTPPDSDPDLPTWPFAVATIAAVAVVAIWSVRRRP